MFTRISLIKPLSLLILEYHICYFNKEDFSNAEASLSHPCLIDHSVQNNHWVVQQSSKTLNTIYKDCERGIETGLFYLQLEEHYHLFSHRKGQAICLVIGRYKPFV
jgi:hypothetical protein